MNVQRVNRSKRVVRTRLHVSERIVRRGALRDLQYIMIFEQLIYRYFVFLKISFLLFNHSQNDASEKEPKQGFQGPGTFPVRPGGKKWETSRSSKRWGRCPRRSQRGGDLRLTPPPGRKAGAGPRLLASPLSLGRACCLLPVLGAACRHSPEGARHVRGSWTATWVTRVPRKHEPVSRAGLGNGTWRSVRVAEKGDAQPSRRAGGLGPRWPPAARKSTCGPAPHIPCDSGLADFPA